YFWWWLTYGRGCPGRLLVASESQPFSFSTTRALAFPTDSAERSPQCHRFSRNFIRTTKDLSLLSSRYSRRTARERRAPMNSAASAPVRQPVPELPEHEIPGAPKPSGTPELNENIIIRLRLLWTHRGLLIRVVLCALLASTLIAFLIPVR